MSRISNDEVQARLEAIPGWSLENGEITKTFKFPAFVESIQFVNRLAQAAEDAQHHPDLDIRYDKVTVTLSTHDAGGLTAADFALAENAENAASTSRAVA